MTFQLSLEGWGDSGLPFRRSAWHQTLPFDNQQAGKGEDRKGKGLENGIALRRSVECNQLQPCGLTRARTPGFVVTVDYIHVFTSGLVLYLADTQILGVDACKAIPLSRPFLPFSLLPFPCQLIIKRKGLVPDYPQIRSAAMILLSPQISSYCRLHNIQFAWQKHPVLCDIALRSVRLGRSVLTHYLYCSLEFSCCLLNRLLSCSACSRCSLFH